MTGFDICPYKVLGECSPLVIIFYLLHVDYLFVVGI